MRAVSIALMLALILMGSVAATFKIRLPSGEMEHSSVYYSAVRAVRVAGFKIERRLDAALNLDSMRLASGENTESSVALRDKQQSFSPLPIEDPRVVSGDKVAAGAPNKTLLSSCRLVQAAGVARPAIPACRT
jgi:hypothetical protein